MAEETKFLINYSKNKGSKNISNFFSKIWSFKSIKDLVYRNLIRNIRFRRIFKWEDRFNHRGLAVFIARNNSIELGLVDKISEGIEKFGFKIVKEKYLDKNDKEKLIKSTPTHKWAGVATGRGYPEVLFVAFDPNPINLHIDRFRKWLKFYPFLDNFRLIFKHSIRYSILKGLDEQHHSCLVHATDNSHEALEYIDILIPRELESIKRKISEYKSKDEQEEHVAVLCNRYCEQFFKNKQ